MIRAVFFTGHLLGPIAVLTRSSGLEWRLPEELERS